MPLSTTELKCYAGMAFEPTGHICRTCRCPVMQSGDAFVCIGCGMKGMISPATICGCGVVKQSGKDMPRFRCVPNPERSPEHPSLVVIEVQPAMAAE